MRTPSQEFVAFAVLLGCVSSACAAAPSAYKTAKARKIMRDFAKCTVKREPVLAHRYVVTNPQNLTDAEHKRVFNWTCLSSGQLKMRPWQYRSALAEELIRVELSGRAAPDFNGLPALDWSVPASENEAIKDLSLRKTQYDTAVAESFVGQLGECVVRATPAGSLAVLQTPNDDPTEIAAMKALAPQIAGCVSAGSTLTFNRTNLRNAMALSYYRLVAGGSAYAQAGAAR